jgi:hypothetical protein
VHPGFWLLYVAAAVTYVWMGCDLAREIGDR